ncbi:MAG: hypothetical protein ACHP65_07710 [Legionellales bacterium]
MVLPKKALRESDITTSSVVDDGSHQTFRVKFIEDGREIAGFYKKLAPKKDYPELLAKLSVATSVFKRVFQSERSAEERLVFNAADELVGTLSINVPGFKSFGFASEAVPADPRVKEQVIPSTKTLLEHNMMEILLGRWFLDDDDAHPHNMGLAGDIDFDMFLYWFTVLMKGPRPLVDIPKSRINLTVSDWERFPNVRDSKPFHWPTYKHPGQETIPLVVPLLQGPLLDKTLPKVYSDPQQFENMASKPMAQEQKIAGALKILLTFQPDMVRRRLQDYFGDMLLNYTSLDASSVDLRKSYETTFPTLCNNKTNTAPFVEFMMTVYQQHYDNLYRVVVFYMGCDNNGYGVPLSSMSNTLYRKPSFYQGIKTWLESQNEMLCSGFQYDLPALQQRYHQIWRDAFAPNLKELLHGLHSLTNQLLLLTTSVKEVEAWVGAAPTDGNVTEAWQLFASMPVLSLEQVKPLIDVDKESDLRSALLALVEFKSQLYDAVRIYYARAINDLTAGDNLAFSTSLSCLLLQYDINVRDYLAHKTTSGDLFNCISAGLKKFTEEVNFQRHLRNTDKQMQDVSDIMQANALAPHTCEAVIKEFNRSLFNWAKRLEPELLAGCIIEIIDKHYTSFFSNRFRGAHVKEYLCASTDISGDTRLAYIFSSGSDSGALNTLLVQHLTPRMLLTQHLPSVRAAISSNIFDASLGQYTKSVVAFAKSDSALIHLYSDMGVLLFYRTLYAWVDAIPRADFKKIIDTALIDYEGASWHSLSFWGVPLPLKASRRKEVEGYYSMSSQAAIIAQIFLKGTDNSAFSERLLQAVITAIRRDVLGSPGKQLQAGYQLILQYNLADHQTLYNQALKTHAMAHRQEVVALSHAAP